jgi:hypothetical protein
MTALRAIINGFGAVDPFFRLAGLDDYVRVGSSALEW